MSVDDETVSTLDGPVWETFRAQVAEPLATVVGWGAATTKGAIRNRNEDSWGHDRACLFAVADGMGGFEGGDVAAETAIRTLVAASAGGADVDWERWMNSANISVRAAARQQGFERSGAAVVGCSIRRGLVTVAHVGDARAYRLRDGVLVALTRDHTVEAELLAEGLGSLIASRSRRELGALTRYLGGTDDVGRPVIESHVPYGGDRLILCSDGVSHQLSGTEISHAATMDDPAGAARELVRLADEHGGRDNATAVCIDFGADNEHDTTNRRPQKGCE